MNARSTAKQANKKQDPKSVVEAFFKACESLDFDKSMQYIDDNCVYKNMPFHTAKGKKRVQRDLNLMAKGMNQFKVDMVNLAVSGDVVMTERVDTIGSWLFKIDIPLMGVLVVKDGKITEWRDYFDWSNMMGNFGKSAIFKRLGIQK